MANLGRSGNESFASRISVVNDGHGDLTGDITGALNGPLDLDVDEPSFFLPVPEEEGERFAQMPNGRENVNGILLNGHAYEEDEEVEEGEEEYDPPEVTSAQAASSAVAKPVAVKKKRKPLPLSRHGIPYPPIPRQAIKKLATKFSGSTISTDTLDALAAASDAFFQQASEDLAAYSKHAGRKVVQDSDVVQLLRRYAPHSTLFIFMNKYLQCSRQRQLNSHTTVFSRAQRHLPRELLQEIRMPVSKVQPRRRQQQRPSLQAVGCFLNHSGPAATIQAHPPLTLNRHLLYHVTYNRIEIKTRRRHGGR